MCKSVEPKYGSPRKAAANLAKPIRANKKLKQISRNWWIRLSKLQTCCGHPGEPGC